MSRPSLRLMVLAGLWSPLLLWPAVQAAASDCPAERTCAAYAELSKARFPAGRGGVVTIPYEINATGAATLTAAQVAGAAQAATAVWERANPRLRFRYLGLTNALAGVPDGVNVIGFGPVSYPFALAEAPIFPTADGDPPGIYDADIIFNASVPWDWRECRQADNACTPVDDDRIPENPFVRGQVADFQSVMTHELGHWLSLAHPDEQGAAQATRQTMSAVNPPGRSGQTLALGDILGVRAMYPCGRCSGRPVVYVP